MILSRAFRNMSSSGTQTLNLTDATAWFDTLSGSVDATNAKNAMQVSPIAAAHRILTNSLGNLPVKVYQRQGDNRQAMAHRLDPLLSVRANEQMTPFVFKKVMMSQAFWYGDAFAYISRDTQGRVVELLPLPSETMAAYQDEQGRLWYAFSVNGQTKKFPADELLHFFFDTMSGKTGRGVLAMARETIQTERLATGYAGKFYRNGARLSGIIKAPSKLDKEGKDIVRNSFERMASGMDNAFRVAVIDLGMEYTPLGLAQKDAQFIESRTFSVEEVARYTGVPVFKLQSGKQAYSSNEQQGLDYVTSTLQPIVVQWEQELAYKLLSTDELRSGYYLRFNMAAEMRGDSESRSKFYQMMLLNGIYSINEVRAFEELNSIPDGDEHFITKNYTPLRLAVKGDGGNMS